MTNIIIGTPPKKASQEQLHAMDRDVFAVLEKEAPALWRACYPRIYAEPTGCGIYFSPKEPAKQLARIAMKIMGDAIGHSEIYEYPLASHLSKFRVPMYWLSQNITEALMQTTPPGKIDWYEMPMPFEAAAFMLPKGSLVHETDGNVKYICYARLRSGEQHFAPLIPKRPYGSVNGILIIGASVEADYFLHWNIPLDAFGASITMQELHDLMTRYSAHEHGSAVPLRTGGGMTQADHDVGAKVAHLLFSSLLLMTARPELVTSGKLSHKTPPKKGREVKEFWSPAVIGEHYRLRREAGPSQGGTHASPRFHWVKGFWREQPYGPGRTLRKELWIEPYTRGLDQT